MKKYYGKHGGKIWNSYPVIGKYKKLGKLPKKLWNMLSTMPKYSIIGGEEDDATPLNGTTPLKVHFHLHFIEGEGCL